MSDSAPCLFCGETARRNGLLSVEGGVLHLPFYVCESCGDYVVDPFVEQSFANTAGKGNAFKIACLVREKGFPGSKRRYGVFDDGYLKDGGDLNKHLDASWSVSDLLAQFPKPDETPRRALANLVRLAQARDDPMARISFKRQEAQYVMFCPSSSSLSSVLEHLQRQGSITCRRDRGEVILRLMPEAWERMKDSAAQREALTQAFVAMWFNAEMDRFEAAFRGGISDAGYRGLLIKDVPHNKKICDQILAEIPKSRFIVADFTAGQCEQCEQSGQSDKCKQKAHCPVKVRPRGSVYFEAGFALGLGLEVIWTVREDQINALQFDIRQYNYITYKAPEDLRPKLKERIIATIGAGATCAEEA